VKEPDRLGALGDPTRSSSPAAKIALAAKIACLSGLSTFSQ